MSARALVGAAAGAASAPGSFASGLFVDDVFSAYAYTGNGATQTINNGIDLAGNGGMVWMKERGATRGHVIFDTARSSGAGDPFLDTSSTSAQLTPTTNYLSYSPTGFNLETAGNGMNGTGQSIASWTFRKAPKFFDVVTYTGNGSTQTINHSLTSTPGAVIIKRTDNASAWILSLVTSTTTMRMSSGFYETANIAQGSAPYASYLGNNTQSLLPNETGFSVGSDSRVNASGGTYVAYIFGNDTSPEGIIRCGVTPVYDGSNQFSVDLGWEPQWLYSQDTSMGYADIVDSMRGWAVGTNIFSGNNYNSFFVPTSASENNYDNGKFAPTSTGFSTTNSTTTDRSFIYIAIRRPNKPPVVGTEVFHISTRSGVNGPIEIKSGFAPDTVWNFDKNRSANKSVLDRLRGNSKNMSFAIQGQEDSAGALGLFTLNVDGATVGNGAWYSGAAYGWVTYQLKRAPGFYDVVCDTGTGSVKTVPHNLAVVPELIIRCTRSNSLNWVVGAGLIGFNKVGLLNTNAPLTSVTSWNNTPPTDKVFTVGTSLDANTANATYVSYLFASLPGISKVGVFVGNGGTQTIDCGFATGARFVLIKNVTSHGNDWLVWDTARGIVSGNDPHLIFCAGGIEVTTDDSIDPHASGFIVNQVAATSINVASESYLFLAIA